MVSIEFGSIDELKEESGGLLVKITKVPSQERIKEARQRTLLTEGEKEECRQYGYKTHLTIHITGDTQKRATNIILVNGIRVPIGDMPFALFLRLVAELFKDKQGTVSKRRLINTGYIKADGEYQSIARLRQAFTVALDNLDPREFVESCEHRCLRLSTHPSLITYDKKKLLQHRNGRIRRLAGRLP